MAKTVDQYFAELQQMRVWRSIFRSGTGSSTLKRALAIQQSVFLHLFPTKVRTRMLSFSATWYLGTLTLGTFLILVSTGIPLMLYYHPSVPQAYADTKDLQFVVSSGMFLRNLHRWSAHAMVFLVFAHMFKVFYRGAYRAPREFNWVIGVILLLITLLLSYTGYLLPWDQLAYWAITVGSNIASAVPLIGNKIHFLLLGGNAVNANALLRFYVLHCMILPLTAIFFVAIHFWRIRKDGGLYSHGSEPATLRAQAETPTSPKIGAKRGTPATAKEGN
jgi:quinol-cytochrome oxidoreductase complex cytochrome b subunit